MPKLFTAIELPEPARAALASLQPPPTPGTRIVTPDQMHVTLHFFGEADVDRVAAPLVKVRVPPFELTLRGVGRFASAENTTTLWAGVEKGPGLLALHEAVGAAIVDAGFRKEQRPYNPHITLARCEAGTPARLPEEFCSKHATFALPAVPVSAFWLYSSTLIDGIPRYQRVRAFELTPNER